METRYIVVIFLSNPFLVKEKWAHTSVRWLSTGHVGKSEKVRSPNLYSLFRYTTPVFCLTWSRICNRVFCLTWTKICNRMCGYTVSIYIRILSQPKRRIIHPYTFTFLRDQAECEIDNHHKVLWDFKLLLTLEKWIDSNSLG